MMFYAISVCCSLLRKTNIFTKNTKLVVCSSLIEFGYFYVL